MMDSEEIKNIHITFRSLQRKSIELYFAEKYQEAMEIDKNLLKDYPDLKTSIYYSMIATASKMKNYELACALLREILDEGGWYSELILRQSPSLAPLQGTPQFEDLVKLSISRSRKSIIPENITVLPENRDPPYPFFLSLHGGGGFIEHEYESWKSIVSEGYLLGIPRSSYLWWSGKDNAYWPDYESSVAEIKTYISELNKNHIIDSNRLYLGGFSQGGGIAIQLALMGDVTARGFIVVAPGGEIIDNPDKWQALIDKNRNYDLSGMIVLGTEDKAVPRDKIKDLIKRMNSNNISCEFVEYPDLDHWYPPDIVNITISFINKNK